MLPSSPVPDSLETQASKLPAAIDGVVELEELLSRPTPAVFSALQNLDSDLVVLGVSGKMGPTLARMAKRAITELGLPYKVYGVARFSDPAARAPLEAAGVEAITCDLLDRTALAQLPDSCNVIFMAGQKFGTTAAQHMTWGINTYLPALLSHNATNVVGYLVTLA